jgi:uncharacterized repeat protein (TIGR03803 family)
MITTRTGASAMPPRRVFLGRCIAAFGCATVLGRAAFAAPSGNTEVKETVLHSFAQEDGYPQYPPIQASDGHLYGTTREEGFSEAETIYRIDSRDGRYQVLHRFQYEDGRHPRSLVEGTDGALYGVASQNQNGTLFRFTLEGEFRVLHEFGGRTRTGKHPNSLMRASNGVMYGTTETGTIFRITGSGNVVRIDDLYFIAPSARLAEAGDGRLYGTGSGGAWDSGAIYRVGRDKPPARELRSFGAPADIGGPEQVTNALTLGDDGALYGLSAGGAFEGGAIFRCTTDGETTVLHSFLPSDGLDGGTDSLVSDGSGGFWGLTPSGGDRGKGTLFRFHADGRLEVLHSFYGARRPARPVGLAALADGRLIGVSRHGGVGDGTVFILDVGSVTG